MVEAITSTLDAMVERAELVRRLAEHASLFAAAQPQFGPIRGTCWCNRSIGVGGFRYRDRHRLARGQSAVFYQEMVDALIASPDRGVGSLILERHSCVIAGAARISWTSQGVSRSYRARKLTRRGCSSRQ